MPLLCGHQTDPGEGGIRSEIPPGSPPTDSLEHGYTDPMSQNKRRSPHTPQGERHGSIDREVRLLLSVRWPTLRKPTPSPSFQITPHEFSAAGTERSLEVRNLPTATGYASPPNRGAAKSALHFAPSLVRDVVNRKQMLYSARRRRRARDATHFPLLVWSRR